MPSDKEETIHSYITDMLALEEHIDKAIEAQLAEFRKSAPDVAVELSKMHENIERHIRDLRAISDRHEGDAGQKVGDAVKRVGSMLAGLGAAAIDLIRTEKLAKNLRDDYTAFALAYIGYTMLNTTALALERADVALLAEQGMKDYAKAQMTLQQLIPAAVLEEMRTEGLATASGVEVTVHGNVRAAWAAAG